MPQQTKQIKSFILSASVTQDGAAVALTFTDETRLDLRSLPPARFAAIVAVLQAARTAAYNYDDTTMHSWVSSGEDAPGL